jgi:glycine/D-amino acid oxidase-like deaminating enzyme/nitrite reductase/ring-hydroxylating ferredoxin subunit
MIARDGSHISVWQETTSSINIQQSFDKRAFDVIIVGAGMTGLTTGLLLQASGLKCAILEAASIGYGTSGGTTAHLNTLMDTPYPTMIRNFDLDTARQVAQSAKEAIQLIKSNISNYGIECGFEECKAFLFAQNEKQANELAQIFDACSKVGVTAMETNTIPIPVPFTKAIAVAGQAKFHPLRYLLGLAGEFIRTGGIIRQDCRVTNVHEGDEMTVDTLQGSFVASHVIYATHIPPTVNLLHLRCAPFRSYAMAFKLRSGTYPTDLAYDMYDPYHYYRSQIIDGEQYMIAGGEDHKTGQEVNSEASFRKLESDLRKHFDIANITHKWSSQYYEPTDGLPYIGRFPMHHKNVLVATGYGGNGMTYSTVAAKILKSIVLDREDESTAIFSPSRVKPVAGFKNFADHNIDAIKNFAEKIFSHNELHGFADLAPGESKVIRMDDQRVGIHKDDNGAVHAVSATCSHLGCTVAWNSAEKSWDCPCHGARYSIDGKVLNGPADRDLEYINLEIITTEK